MKIVYIYKSMVLLAGMERILSTKMNLLAEKYNHEIYFITYEQGNHPLSFRLSKKIRHINLDFKFYERYKYRFIKKNYLLYRMKINFQRSLSNILNSIQPDIIITTTYEYQILDNIYKSYPSAKFILESHVAKETEMTSTHIKTPVLHQFAKFWDLRISLYIQNFNRIVTLTNQDKDSWEKHKNVVVIPNMIEYPTHINRIPSKKIISVGRLNVQKGFDMLIDAWKMIVGKHTDWSLHIYGDGELRGELNQQIAQCGLNDTVFIHPPTSDIFSKYQEHEFYVMSSRYEGLPLALIEALSHGLPCISFNCPCGPSEIIKNGIDGYLIPTGNIEQLAQKIEYLIENETERLTMGKNARRNAIRYSENEIIDSWNELFLNL